MKLALHEFLQHLVFDMPPKGIETQPNDTRNFS
jgi:hypothetical protein